MPSRQKNLKSWPSCHGLRIGHLNIRSIVNKMHEVPRILNNTKNNFHIFGFTESRLKQYHDKDPLKADQDDLVAVDDYEVERRGVQKYLETGIIAYIHPSISYKRRTSLEQHGVESLWLEVIMKGTRPILICFCYRNDKELVDWRDERFTAMMDSASLEAKEIILLGDFNINVCNDNKKWFNTTETYHLTQIIDTPTRVNEESQTIIDHIYVSEKHRAIEVCVPSLGISDHFPVCLTWSMRGVRIPKTGHKTITYRSFSSFNQDSFLTDLMSSSLNDVYNHTDPNTAVDFWIQTFSKIYDKHAPLTTKRVKHTRYPEWMTKELQQEIFLRDDLLKAKKYKEFKQQRNKVNSLKRSAKKTYFRQQASKNNPKATWRAINQLTNKGNASRCSHIKEITSEELNSHFSSIANKIILEPDKAKDNDLSILQDFCSKKNIHSALNIPFMTTLDVYTALIQLKQNRVRGMDEVDGQILKTAAPAIFETLTYVFNLCIEKNIFPSSFKQAKILPLFKSGEKSDPSNYRPISILPVLSKPLERHMHKHLLAHFTRNKLFHDNQSGFRKHHSCHTAMTNLVDKWLDYLQNNVYGCVLFVDFAKAFDVIDHSLLLKKLKMYRVADKTLSFLESFLSNRQQLVVANGIKSSMKRLHFGVPQGSVLGPLLFLSYVNDLPLHMETPCELFADDTTIHTCDSNLDTLTNTIQNSISDLTKWTKLNHMSLNPTKTKCMLITTRQKRQLLPKNPHNLPQIYIDTQPIEEVNHHKILGVTVDNNLAWSQHIQELCKSLGKKIYQLSRIKHFLDFDTRLLFFKTHIQSSFDYVSTIWDSASKEQIKPLRSIYNRGLKLVLLKNSTLHANDFKSLNVLTLEQRLTYNKGVMMHKIMSGKAPPKLFAKFKINKYARRKYKLKSFTPRIDLVKSSLQYSGSALWNELPDNIRCPMATGTFKDRLKIHLSH